MICGLCLTDVPRLVESHIVPKAIATDAQGDDGFSMIVGSASETHPKRVQTGIYSLIVCAPCEKSFQEDDDLLIAAWRALPTAPAVWSGKATELIEFDGGKLQRSLLTVLFRAHLSQHGFYRHVILGPHAEPLRRYVRGERKEVPAQFSIVLRHVPTDFGGMTLSPKAFRLCGANTYNIYLPHVIATVKVDRKAWPKALDGLALTAGDAPLALRSERLNPQEMVAGFKLAEENSCILDRKFRGND